MTIILHSDALRVTLLLSQDSPACIRSVEPNTTSRSRPKAPHSPFFSDAELPLVQARLNHEGNNVYKTSKSLVGSGLASRLRYQSHHEEVIHGISKTLSIVQRDSETEIAVTSYLTVYEGFPALRSYCTLRNESDHDVLVTQLSSLAIGGLTTLSSRWWEDYVLTIANNSWFREAQWVEHSLPSMGLDDYGIYNAHEPHRVSSLARITISNQGTFSTEGHLPMGILSRKGEMKDVWLWQVEHNGPWAWELGDFKDSVYLVAGGPASQTGHEFRHRLAPGACFSSVPVALSRVVDSDVDAAFSAMTRYRRQIRRYNPDTVQLPVIFNDYMNCLSGDPTEDKISALLKPAADAGAEYFVIDAGWYADDDGWWDDVGAWEPSTKRFPSGFDTLLGAIRAAGFIPGLWLEPEVIGVRSKVAATLPSNSFFSRDGSRVVERRRYQLDLRQPVVRSYLTQVISRLVNSYGVGYFKFDYNIDVSCGTDVDGDASSPGAALLLHNRAYLAWIQELLDTHDGLVIENCSSGGQRMDYATLSVHSIQSISDQEDVVRLAAVAAAAPTAVAPEQGAVWIYPQPGWNEEMIAFSVVNALLGRIHLSGRLDLLSAEKLALVTDGLRIYKEVIRGMLASALPFWPLGLPGWHDDWLALGMVTKTASGEGAAFVAVWCRSGPLDKDIPIAVLRGKKNVRMDVLYPTSLEVKMEWKASEGVLHMTLPQTLSARLVRMSWEEL